ncbi:GGDEF domain-containing protein [Desulfurobacterium thermolithotrophum]|uniref:GGDEF domain-containing protein n=1 Tax=Desulfurobacterium thermolithotrophum TaxID=64160 RepID=UPI0023795AE1|nr:GGDEF domain-containing protein [Desulfurobacterium thermolithotrophum]
MHLVVKGNTLNRRGFFQIALEKFKTAKRYNIPFSVILLDIDYFKKINDTYGHTVGDKVIAEMALILKNNLRESDAIGRFGGEEFIIACSHTNFDQAVLLVEKIQDLVRKHFIHYHDRKIRFTVSIGFLTLENPAKRRLDFEKIIHLADKALYLAKEIRNSAVGIKL